MNLGIDFEHVFSCEKDKYAVKIILANYIMILQHAMSIDTIFFICIMHELAPLHCTTCTARCNRHCFMYLYSRGIDRCTFKMGRVGTRDVRD